MLRGSRGFLRARIFPLLAIGQAHRRAQLVLRDVLEAGEMFARFGCVAGLLVGTRQSEFGGRVQPVQLERMLERIDGWGKLLLLQVDRAQ